MNKLKSKVFSSRNILSGLAIIVTLFGLIYSSLINYLLFHTVVELFTILVSFGVFVIAWNSRQFIDNDFYEFLGISFLFVGSIDLVHTLAYKGMNIFQGYGANLPTQLWIAARYLHSLSFLIAPLFLRRKLKPYLLIFIYFLITTILLASIFLSVFPNCYIDGSGLTDFKIKSEYIISLIFVISILHLFKNRKEFNSRIFTWIITSLLLMIGGEIAFTFYVSVYGLSNLVGHIFKLLSFFFVFKSVIETGLREPFDLVFRRLDRNIKKAEKANKSLSFNLAKLREEIRKRKAAEEERNLLLKSLMEAQRISHIGSWDWDFHTSEESWSQELFHIFGRDPNLGVPPVVEYEAQYHPDDKERVKKAIDKSSERNQIEVEFRIFRYDDQTERFLHLSAETIFDESGKPLHLHGTVQDVTNLKKAVQSLRESEARFRAFMDNFPAAAYIKDSQLKHIYGNKIALDLAGRSPGEYVGIKTSDIYPQKTAVELESLDRIVLKEQRVVSREGYYPTHDGEMLWKRDIKFPLTGPHGEKMVGGIALDLTRQKQAQDAIRRNEAKLQAIMDATPFPIALVDQDDINIRMWSHSALDLFGYTAPTSAEWYQIAFPDPEYRQASMERLGKEFEQARESQELVNTGEYQVTCQNGSVRICELYAKFLKDDLVITFNDITDRKHAESEIMESEQKFRGLFTAMSSGFALFDLVYDKKGNPTDLRFLQVNPSYERHSGFKAKDLLGKTLLDIVPDLDPKWISTYSKVAQTGKPFQGEDFNQRLKKYFNYKAFSPQKGQVAIITTDINQQKTDQLALQQRAEELERFNRLTVGRELKMIDLKKEINDLCKQIGETPRYNTSFADDEKERKP